MNLLKKIFSLSYNELKIKVRDRIKTRLIAKSVKSCNPLLYGFSYQRRIGKEGYLESASALLDRFYPHPYRKIEILENKKKLILNRKKQGVHDHYLAESRLFQTNKKWNFLFTFFPNMFFITYKWKEKIEFSYLENKSIKSKSLTQMWVDHFVETCNTISKNNTLNSRVINLINVFHIRSKKKDY